MNPRMLLLGALGAGFAVLVMVWLAPSPDTGPSLDELAPRTRAERPKPAPVQRAEVPRERPATRLPTTPASAERTSLDEVTWEAAIEAATAPDRPDVTLPDAPERPPPPEGYTRSGLLRANPTGIATLFEERAEPVKICQRMLPADLDVDALQLTIEMEKGDGVSWISHVKSSGAGDADLTVFHGCIESAMHGANFRSPKNTDARNATFEYALPITE